MMSDSDVNDEDFAHSAQNGTLWNSAATGNNPVQMLSRVDFGIF